MSGRTEPSEEAIDYLANLIIDSMSLEEMKQFIFDDLIDIMSKDVEVYEANLDIYGEE